MFWLVVGIVFVVLMSGVMVYDRRHPGSNVRRSSPMTPLVRPPGGATRGLIEADQADERRRERQQHPGRP